MLAWKVYCYLYAQLGMDVTPWDRTPLSTGCWSTYWWMWGFDASSNKFLSGSSEDIDDPTDPQGSCHAQRRGVMLIGVSLRPSSLASLVVAVLVTNSDGWCLLAHSQHRIEDYLDFAITAMPFACASYTTSTSVFLRDSDQESVWVPDLDRFVYDGDGYWYCPCRAPV